MKRLPFLFAGFVAIVASARAAVPPPEQLLPADTLAFLTVPDCDKARAVWNASAGAQFWNAPEMKPFKEKFLNKLRADVLAPIEKELGITLSNYTALARGQVTLAVSLNGADTKPGGEPGVMLLIDTRDKAAEAGKLLAELKKRWVDGGRSLKTAKVRDVEFTTATVDGGAIAKSLEKTFPKPPGRARPPGDQSGDRKGELSVGQSGSLLMIGNDPAAFEKVLVRLSGGSVPVVGDQANYANVHGALLRESFAYGWFNAKSVMELALKELNKQQGQQQNNPLGAPPMATVLDALGLTAMQSGAVYLTQQTDGFLFGLYAGVPEASRKGIFKILAPEAKDASPPAFVPADTTKFFRWRLDGQKTWASIESLIYEIVPQARGVLAMILENAGKDKDPGFDLKKMLIGNLGDDLVSFEKAPRSAKMEDILSAPAMMLVGSPRAEQLAGAIRTGLGFMIPPGVEGGSQEREFLGRKVYAFPMPSMPGQINTEPKLLSFTASGSYVAFSPDTPLFEEYLRGPEAQGRPLRDLPGLNEAAQKVGGMGTGMFGYENQTETLRLLYEALRKEPDAFEKLFAQGALGMPLVSSDMRRNRQEWLDFTLLPPWDTVAKFFHYSVYAASATADGLHIKSYSPDPPGLKK